MQYKPNVLHLDITGRCNLSCLHCRGTYSLKDLSLEQWKKVLDQFSKHWKEDIRWVEIGGGEPFIRRDLDAILKHVRKSLPKSKILLVTNGTVIGEKEMALIKKYVDRIQFSIDGAYENTHNKIRGRDCFKKTISNLKKLRKNKNTYLIIRATINKLNYAEFEEIVKLGKELDVNEVGMRAMVVSGGSSKENSDLEITPAEYLKLLKDVPRLQKKHKIRIYSGDPLQNLVDPLFVNYLKRRNKCLENCHAGCLVGVSYIYVNNEGKMAFCPMLNGLEIGDLLKEDVSIIWEKNEILKKLRTLSYSQGSKCNKCRFKSVCGGCRARALNNGDLFSKDPMCSEEFLEEVSSCWESEK